MKEKVNFANYMQGTNVIHLVVFFLNIDLPITMSDDIKCQHIATVSDTCLLSIKAPLVSDMDVMLSHLGIVAAVG